MRHQNRILGGVRESRVRYPTTCRRPGVALMASQRVTVAGPRRGAEGRYTGMVGAERAVVGAFCCTGLWSSDKSLDGPPGPFVPAPACHWAHRLPCPSQRASGLVGLRACQRLSSRCDG